MNARVIWSRIGARHGPGSGRPAPTTLPRDWDDDRGQFYQATVDEAGKGTLGLFVWRRGHWELCHDRATKRETIQFFFHGPGYADYECTRAVVPEKDFNGAE